MPSTAPGMARILVVDDDPGAGLARALTQARDGIFAKIVLPNPRSVAANESVKNSPNRSTDSDPVGPLKSPANTTGSFDGRNRAKTKRSRRAPGLDSPRSISQSA